MKNTRREKVVVSGNYQCPGGCGLILTLRSDGTLQCDSPRCDRKGVRYRKPTEWLEIVEETETCSESETNVEAQQTTPGGEHQQRRNAAGVD